MKQKRKLNKKRTVFAIGSILASMALIAAISTAAFQVIGSWSQSPAALCSRSQPTLKQPSCLSDAEIASLNQNGIADKKVAFLTFDDGPSSKTKDLLAILTQYHVKANFFLIGNNIDGNEANVQAIAQQGSAVFVHSTSHRYNDIYASEEAFRTDVATTVNKIKQLGIAPPYMFRFPGGSNTGYIDSNKFSAFQKIVHDNGMEYIDWNIDSGDASGTNPDAKEIIAAVTAQLENKHYANILMHDAADKAATREALPGIIQALKDNGFIICKLPRGLQIPQFQ